MRFEGVSVRTWLTSICRVGSVDQIALGCDELAGTAEIAPIGSVSAEADNPLAFGHEAHIRIDDGKCAVFVELSKDARRDDVDAGEGEGLERRRGAVRGWLGFVRDAAAQ